MATTRKSNDDAEAVGEPAAETSAEQPATDQKSDTDTKQAAAPAKPAAKESKPAKEPAEEPAAKEPAKEPAAKEAKPTKDSKPAKESTRLDRSEEKDKKRTVAAGANALRSRIASVIWLIAVVCALFLAVGALLVALKANQDNGIVSFVLDVANRLDGPFSRENGLFTFDGKSAATKSALVNWGLGAVAYLIVGKILDRVIRP